jgi:hypothetical protein
VLAAAIRLGGRLGEAAHGPRELLYQDGSIQKLASGSPDGFIKPPFPEALRGNRRSPDYPANLCARIPAGQRVHYDSYRPDCSMFSDRPDDPRTADQRASRSIAPIPQLNA